MTREARRAAIEDRLAAIRAACDACLPDDPPWAEIEELFQIVDALLREPPA